MKHILIQRQRVALVLFIPGMLMAQGATAKGIIINKPGGAQKAESTHLYLKFAANFHKHKGDLANVGMLSGQPVFRTSKGEFFTVEPATGNLKFHTADSLGFMKIQDVKGKMAAPPARTGMFIKFDGIKGEAKVSIAGVDAQGRVVQENSRGEKFVLGPNGDMQFVK